MVKLEKLLDCIISGDGGVYLDLKVNPNADKSSIDGVNRWRNNVCVSIKAEAREGKANKELLDFLSQIFKIDISMLEITKGARNSNKRLFVRGVSDKALADKILSALENERS